MEGTEFWVYASHKFIFSQAHNAKFLAICKVDRDVSSQVITFQSEDFKIGTITKSRRDAAIEKIHGEVDEPQST
jgi:hypothetical protein